MSTSSISDLAARIGGTAADVSPASAPAQGTGSPGSFADALEGLVANTDKSAEQANAAVGGMLNKSVDVHDAMIALQRAEMSLQLTVQIRNKLVQAYQEIMRMPV